MSILRSVNSGRNRIVKSYSFKWTDTREYKPYEGTLNYAGFRPLSK